MNERIASVDELIEMVRSKERQCRSIAESFDADSPIAASSAHMHADNWKTIGDVLEYTLKNHRGGDLLCEQHHHTPCVHIALPENIVFDSDTPLINLILLAMHTPPSPHEHSHSTTNGQSVQIQ